MEKHKKIDTKAIEYHIAGILKALGDNPEMKKLRICLTKHLHWIWMKKSLNK